MHIVGQAIAQIFGPLAHTASMLADQFMRLARTPFGSFELAAMVVVSIVFAAACGAWAITERQRTIRHRQRLHATVRRQQSGIRFRDALLNSHTGTTLIMASGAKKTLSFAGGNKLLQHCLAGPDAKRLAACIDSLLSKGTDFDLAVRTIAIRDVLVRGRIVRSRPVIYLQYASPIAKLTGKSQASDATLSGLPALHTVADAANGRFSRRSAVSAPRLGRNHYSKSPKGSSVMFSRTVFLLLLAWLLMPHEPDIGFGRPGMRSDLSSWLASVRRDFRSTSACRAGIDARQMNSRSGVVTPEALA